MSRAADSKGAFRVGTGFNPSGDGMVERIKRAAADLIDLIEAIEPPASADGAPGMIDGEVRRLKALAQTDVESAAMWAVKAATKRAPEG